MLCFPDTEIYHKGMAKEFDEVVRKQIDRLKKAKHNKFGERALTIREYGIDAREFIGKYTA